MKNQTDKLVTLLLALGLCVPSLSAQAESVKLHQLQSQALLSFAGTEVNVLNGALSAREFDMALTTQLADSLAKSLKQAKKHADRTTDLLSEKQEKMRPKFEKMRKHLVDAERQLSALQKDIASQVKPYMDFAENSEEGAEAPPDPDWNLLKRHLGWIAFDLSQAQRLHRHLSKKLRLPKLRTPRKPKGSRE